MWQTRVTHSGRPVEGDNSLGELNVPICTSTTFEQLHPGRAVAYEYSRSGNPTRAALEGALATLEEAKYALAFPSGLAALTVILSAFCQMVREGQPTGAKLVVVCSHDVYGGTARLFNRLAMLSLRIDRVIYHDFSSGPQDLVSRLPPNERYLFWLEIVSNPTLQVIDLVQVVQGIRGCVPDALVVVDNTFVTPVLQRPLHLHRYLYCNSPSVHSVGSAASAERGITEDPAALKVDLVTHSATKYLNGHCDVVMGVAMTNDAKLHEALKFAQNALGCVPAPFDCYLAVRGIKTLSLRFERQCANAMKIAEVLSQSPKVKRVLYPGLPSHGNYNVLARQQEAAVGSSTGPLLFGAMVSMELACGPECVERFVGRLRWFILAESLGGVESLIEVPALMTHRGLPPETLRSLGISPQFLRLSVGIEDVRDLIGDLLQALDQLS